MTPVGPATRAQTRRLALMAVVAVLLATVVAANLAEGPGTGVEDPRASFTFATEGDDVVVTHYGGDELDPAHVWVESGVRGRLGTFDGSGGPACTRNLTRVTPGATCRVPDSRDERLYVVWDAGENRSLILARRPADPTTSVPTTSLPTSTAVSPSATPTLTPPVGGTPTGTASPTPGTGTPETAATTSATGTEPPSTGTATREGTQTPTASPSPTPTASPTPDGTPTPTATATSEPNQPPPTGNETTATATATASGSG